VAALPATAPRSACSWRSRSRTPSRCSLQEIDLWWRKGPKFRIAGQRRGSLSLEPRLNGRLFETFEHPKGVQTFTTGTITRWEPPHALAFEWRGVNFKPGEKTLVEVSFAALGEGTMVKLRHSGWSTLPAGHPARHGLEGAPFSAHDRAVVGRADDLAARACSDAWGPSSPGAARNRWRTSRRPSLADERQSKYTRASRPAPPR
jgi:uncharacterized protein YndB with AHSA1/START domain